MKTIEVYKIPNEQSKNNKNLNLIKTFCNGFVKLYSDLDYEKIFKEDRFVLTFFDVTAYDAFNDEQKEFILKELIKEYHLSTRAKNNMDIDKLNMLK